MAERYFLPEFPSGDCSELAGSEFHHLAHVMRANPGDHIVVFDGQGNQADAQIVGISKSRASLRLADRRLDPSPRRNILLATAVPKADRFRWLVEKATELGVSRLIPLQTTRSVVAPGVLRLEKARQTVIEACKQSGRNRLMSIEPLTRWEDLLRETFPTTVTFVADPTGRPLAAFPADARANDVLLVAGPEGGLTAIEGAQAVEAGASLVSLGPRVLRVETAAIVLSAYFCLEACA